MICLRRCLPFLFAALLPPPASAVESTPVDQITVKEGFQVERLYSVPKEEQGSWVSICADPRGRLIVSDQYGALYRLVPPIPGEILEPGAIEKIDLPIGQAHGLLYAFDSLYAVVANDAYQGRGLYRIRDTDDDDRFDEVKQLRKLYDGGEHGPHSVILSPDGESLHVIVGNQTPIPEMERTRVVPVWQEDQLLPRVYGRGFMQGVLAPRGWIAKTDPEGETWELVATGFRNQYDAAFNRDGELFTFDADMEWDFNTPWYRPTRVCHVVSGAEFGWRNGSGKWPVYYEDSVPPVVDIGPGSPTGVCFGYGAAFPAKYQDAFYICDWSYGKLYAVHTRPQGASYAAEFEEFASAQPLPLTDLTVNPEDGALYFTTGGRRTQSGLYRITYTGAGAAAAAVALQPADPSAESLRRLRHRLESLHLVRDPQAVETAWEHLGHADRFIRYAARTALEHQPVTAWMDRSFQERDPEKRLQAGLAMARVGFPSLKLQVLQTLKRCKWPDMTKRQRLTLIRTYGVLFSRMGPPPESSRDKILTQLDRYFPCDDATLNIELCQLLVYLEAPEVAPRSVALLNEAPTQEEQIAYAKSLRMLEKGWTSEDREAYFKWFVRAATYKGGASFDQFVTNIKTDAVARLTEDERQALQPILDARPESSGPQFAMEPRLFVREWTMQDLEGLLGAGLEGNRDFENGRNLFGAAACFSCHRFQSEGGAMGPDLTGVGGRFSPRDLLESILEPSKEISDQYNATVVTLDDGSTVTGRVVNLDGDTIMLNTNMLDPGSTTNIDRNRIESIHPAETSMMPPGLLNTLTEDDILDLLAYLLSQGDAEHPMFQ